MDGKDAVLIVASRIFDGYIFIPAYWPCVQQLPLKVIEIDKLLYLVYYHKNIFVPAKGVVLKRKII